MAKEDYLQGYGQGLKRGKENPITGPINKTLDKALGNPHESARRGLDQGYDEMKKAKEAERIKEDAPDMSIREILGKMVGKETPKELKPITKSSDMPERKVTTKLKTGGVVKDLKKAGFYDAKKDKAKRLSIINKVTTKPERIEMVDKMFSAKKMAKGGTASSRADGCAVRGKTKA